MNEIWIYVTPFTNNSMLLKMSLRSMQMRRYRCPPTRITGTPDRYDRNAECATRFFFDDNTARRHRYQRELSSDKLSLLASRFYNEDHE